MANPCDLPDKRFFRPNEVAQILDISRASVYRAVESGQLQAIRVNGSYRITRDSLLALLSPENT